MPSIRIRQHTSYTSLHAVPDTECPSTRLPQTPSTNPATSTRSIPRRPKTRPSLPVLASGSKLPKYQPRLNPTLSRVQSHVLRGSIRNSRASLPSTQNSPQISNHLPTQLRAIGSFSRYPEGASGTAVSPGERGEGGWADHPHHHDDIVEYLDVIDARVSAVSTLTNTTNSIIIPPTPLWERKPVITLPPQHLQHRDEETRESIHEDALDRHVDDVIRRPLPIRRTLHGVWAFLKTPIGIIAGIYGFLVVFWGAAIVIFLARIINLHNDDLQGFWIEVSSQVVNGLFTATGIGLIPSRVVDTYRIYKIWYYKRRTIHLRKQAGLAQLFDPDDLPDPVYDDNYVHVLTDEEQKDLHRQQVKFQYHQTWYRAHGSETHRAFPINIALAICLLNDGNSVFQIMLCGTMWGLDRFQRPAWSTATLITASFLCGIGAAILIWRGGKRTKRVDEIRQKLRDALVGTPHLAEELASEPPPMGPASNRGSGDYPRSEGLELTETVNPSSEKLTVRDRGDNLHPL